MGLRQPSIPDGGPSLEVQHVINFTEGPSRDDVDKHWKDRRVLRVRRFRLRRAEQRVSGCRTEDQIPEFVQRIAPQPEKAIDLRRRSVQPGSSQASAYSGLGSLFRERAGLSGNGANSHLSHKHSSFEQSATGLRGVYLPVNFFVSWQLCKIRSFAKACESRGLPCRELAPKRGGLALSQGQKPPLDFLSEDRTI